MNAKVTRALHHPARQWTWKGSQVVGSWRRSENDYRTAEIKFKKRTLMNTMKTLGLLVLVSILSLSTNADQQTAETKHEKTWRGTLAAVNAQDNTIRCRRWLLTRTFQAGEHCAISAVDKNEAALSDLYPGEKVQIRYRKAEGVRVADRIAERELRYAGRVQDLDRKDGIVTIRNG